MKIKPGTERKYSDGLDCNQDPYGRGIYTYAKRWAELLETDIEASGNAEESIRAHAEERSHEADTEGITGFMYFCAVLLLADVWEHGELLRRWHNAKYGHKGDGVVNPSVLIVERRTIWDGTCGRPYGT